MKGVGVDDSGLECKSFGPSSKPFFKDGVVGEVEHGTYEVVGHFFFLAEWE